MDLTLKKSNKNDDLFGLEIMPVDDLEQAYVKKS